MTKINVPSFDDAIDAFENGGDSAAKREEAKLAKYNQLITRNSDLKMKIIKQKSKLKKSYHDAGIDTVQVHLDLQVLEKEFDVCNQILTGLFPDGIGEPVGS